MQIWRWKRKCNFIFHSFLNITKTWSKNPARTATSENTMSLAVMAFVRKMNERKWCVRKRHWLQMMKNRNSLQVWSINSSRTHTQKKILGKQKKKKKLNQKRISNQKRKPNPKKTPISKQPWQTAELSCRTAAGAQWGAQREVSPSSLSGWITVSSPAAIFHTLWAWGLREHGSAPDKLSGKIKGSFHQYLIFFPPHILSWTQFC